MVRNALIRALRNSGKYRRVLEYLRDYPPLAQFVFRIAHWLAPGSVLAMKVVVVPFDLSDEHGRLPPFPLSCSSPSRLRGIGSPITDHAIINTGRRSSWLGEKPMDARKLIDASLRVLKMIQLGQQPDVDDVSIIRTHALPEESRLSASELASELIKREIAKRRAATSMHA